MPLHGRATWPGLRSGVVSCTYTCSHGETPGVATLTVPMQPTAGIAQQGTLTLFDGVNPPVRLRDCRVVHVGETEVDGGRGLVLHIADRRWAWRLGEISGWYNQNDPYPDARRPGAFLGRPGVSAFVPGTERSPKQILDLCLARMGELGRAAFGRVPGDARPVADWQAVRPATALQSVADAVGCRLIFQPNRDGVAVAPPSGPSDAVQLPAGRVISENPVLDAPTPPSEIKVVGGAALVGDFWKLEAVGLEADGRVRPLRNLSYIPPRGWWPYWPGTAHWADCVQGDSPDVNTSKGGAKRKKKKKKGLVGGPVDAPRPVAVGVKGAKPQAADAWLARPVPKFPRLGHPRQVTLLPDLFGPEKDARGQLTSSPAKLYADSFDLTQDKQFRGQNRAFPKALEATIQIDERGLVRTDQPIFRVASGAEADAVKRAAYAAASVGGGSGGTGQSYEQWAAVAATGPTPWVVAQANVFISTSARIRHPETWHEIRGEWSRAFGGPPTPPEVLQRGELVPVYSMVRSPELQFRLQDVVTNLDELAEAAGFYIDAAARKHAVRPALTRTYAGLLPVDPDAAIEQVTWGFGVDSPPTTTISVGTEHDAYLPTYPERRRAEAVAQFVTTDWVNQTLGIYKGKGAG